MKLSLFAVVLLAAASVLISGFEVEARLPKNEEPATSRRSNVPDLSAEEVAIFKSFGYEYEIMSSAMCVAKYMRHGFTEAKARQACGLRASLRDEPGAVLVREAAEECSHESPREQRYCMKGFFEDRIARMKAKSQEATLRGKTPVTSPAPSGGTQ
jgi:hypothetical protein